jgi:integrase
MVAFIIEIADLHKLSRATCKKYIQILYSFFDYLQYDKKLITENPCTRLPKVGKVVDCAPIPFTSDDRERLRQAIEKNNPQLWIACEIQYYCAVRPGTELRLMKVGWIDFKKGEIRIPSVEAKNSKSQIVQMPKQLIDCLHANRIENYAKDLYLFGKNGIPGDTPLGKNTMRNRFNLYREALNISDAHKYYSWKHSGAVTAVENGMTPFELKEHLRHSSVETTERYIKNKRGNYIKDIDKFY